MANDVEIAPLLDTGYAVQQIQEGKNAVFKDGRLVYIILDVDKPGKYFFDLRTVFNATTGEGGKDLKIMFMNNVTPWQLNGKTIGIHGWYPSGVDYHVTGSPCQANSSLYDFVFPLGMFQEAGIYKFQFEITDESGNLATSHYCFFQVTQNATTMAFNWNNGVNPFDSDYAKWKNDVNTKYNDFLDKINTLNDTSDRIEKLMQDTLEKTNQYVEQAWDNKLASENTWTGKQHFNGGVTASTVGGNMLSGSNLSIDSSATLPANTTFGGKFSAMNIFRYVSTSDNVTLLNATKSANTDSSKTWMWSERYETHAEETNYPHFFFYFALKIDCSDTGKPIAQFPSGFFKGANSGPISISVGSGTIGIYPKASDDCLYLQYASGVSGQVTLATKIWS